MSVFAGQATTPGSVRQIPGSRASPHPAPAARTADAVWFVARHGVLPWVMLIVTVVCAAVLGMRGAPWRGDLLWIVDWLPIGHLAIAPVVAGGAAIDIARLSVGTRHLEDIRWWRSPGSVITLAYATGVGGTYVTAMLVAAVIDLPPRLDPRALLGVGVQLLMLALFAALGTLVGRVLGPVLGGVLAAILALTAIYLLSARTEHIALLYAGASVVSRVGRSYDVAYLGSQAGLLSGLVVALVLMRPGVVRGRWRRAGERSVAAIAVGAVVVAAFVGPSSRLTHTDTPPDLCSDVVGVKVCLYAEHARLQGEVAAQLSRIFDGARAAGYDDLVPREVREVPSSGVTSWKGPQILLDGPLGGGAVDVETLVQDVVIPYHCMDGSGETSDYERFAADALALQSTWLALIESEQPSVSGPAGPRLTPQDAARVMADLRACGESSR
ncbi:hypothetical protein [Cellulomonas uda]|uniref:Uncharacterized protein n=1 Tax=Cellulomonas uda TaxID=1714 RepID=A0A4Y3KEC3_CELUD|nr:hypothetical protein [Cellulomonas uda]NII67484.1 hypothetical protein [Cellulomonas uda]GEA82357.1 hypothetical protein CUD01_28010 [Cellulomonas uda]